MKRSVIASLFLVLCFLVASAGSRASALDQPVVSLSRDSSKRLYTSLSAPGAPAPGGSVELTFEVQLLEPVTALTIEWVAPPGVEIIGDASEVIKDKPAGATVRSTRKVRFASAGVFRVDAVASFEPNASARFGSNEALFFTIQARESSVSVADPQAVQPARSNRPTREKDLSTLQAPAEGMTSLSGDPCFSVSGTLRRLDKIPTLTGYTDVPNAPVRYALVELRDWDELDDESYGFAVTNENGYFRFPTFCDDDGIGDDVLELFIRVHAEVRDPEHTGFRVAFVEDSSWIDEEYEFDRPYVQSGGGAVTLDWTLDNTASGIMNITEAAYNAWKFWNVSGGVWGGAAYFNHTAEIHWEYNYPESSGSHYNGWTVDEITINGEAAGQDQWEETVVMHEWTHFAEDKYGCDDSPGGPHSFDAYLEDAEFSMSEGFADFYPSAVRRWLGDPFANYYISNNPVGSTVSYRNLETYTNPGDPTYPRYRTYHNEMSVAATFWDLIDTVPDLQDRAALPYSVIQQGFTNASYVNNGIIDDTCDLPTFFTKWNEAGLPSTREVAATIYQNVGLIPWSGPTTQGIQTTNANWWHRVVFALDNSASMSGEKFTAAKSAINDAANQLSAAPQGAEFSLNVFNNNNSEGQNIFTGLFYPADVAAQVNSLSTVSDTDTCEIDSLRASVNAVGDKVNGDVWLITDRGFFNNLTAVNSLSGQLINSRMRANIAFLGGCAAPDPSCASTNLPEQQSQQARSALAELVSPVAIQGLAEDLVLYITAAERTGGQFMYIGAADLPNAAQIMSSVINHTTGSGRWSDYVSLNSTYAWEKLATYQYHWIDAKATGTNHGTPVGEGYLTIPIPSPYFKNAYRWDTGYAELRAYENGYLTFGPHGAVVSANTNLPNAAEPNLALYPFWDDLVGDEPDLLDGKIYSVQSGDWFVIEYADFWNSAVNQNITFEVLLNLVTGEVRYQYQQVDFDSGSATIGAENESGTAAVVISYNDTKGASAGMGYKLTPAPAVPSRVYNVSIPPGARSLGILLNGYSGTLAPLDVVTPFVHINCSTAHPACFHAGSTNFIWIGTPAAGNYQITVRPGASGEGTYGLTVFTDGGLVMHSGRSHINTTLLTVPMSITLNRPVDGNLLLAQFNRPNGTTFGSTFFLYDDGLHGDGQAGDGRFASAEFLPPAAGTVYLSLLASINSQLHTFTDEIPYTFQPVDVDSLGDKENFGGATQVDFYVYNDDSVAHCFDLDTKVPEGWHATLPDPTLCLSASSNSLVSLTVYMAPGLTNTLPSGRSGEVTLSVTEQEKGIIIGSDHATVTRRRPPALVKIENLVNYLAPNGEQSDLIIQVYDAEGWPVQDGLTVNLSTTLGELPSSAVLQRGRAVVTFTTNDKTGTALITATAGAASAQTSILVQAWELKNAKITADPTSLPGNGVSTATIQLTVTNAAKQPVKGQAVRLRLSGDDTSFGMLNGGLVVNGTTDDLGQFSATYTSPNRFGRAVILAEVLDATETVLLTSQVQVELTGIQRFLPLISR